jgi:hypothetical protein
VVELERKKKADAESRIATIKEAIAQLRWAGRAKP